MGYNEDFKKFAESHPKCKSCEFYDIDNANLKIENEYYGKVAICLKGGSGRYKVGHNSICCEFYKQKAEEIMKFIKVAGKKQVTTNGKGNMSAFMYKSKRKGKKK